MEYGSLFCGIGGFDAGFDSAGMSCLWQVERDGDALRVLGRHWPQVAKFSDVKEVGRHNLKRVDVICGGFPCQDLSVAGKRGGLSGVRSGLFWEMLRIVHELQPRVLVWENVPGLSSSDGGRDMRRILSSLAEHNYFGCVRTLDARYFGVAQRRRRLFGVFARGDTGAGRCAEILALTEGCRRHPAAGREAEPDVAGTIGSCSSGRGRNGDLDRAGAFLAFNHQAGGSKAMMGFSNTHTTALGATQTPAVLAQTLRSRQSNPGVNAPGRGGEDDQNLVVAPTLTAQYGEQTGRDAETPGALVYQCHGSNVGPMGTVRSGNGGLTGGVPFTAFTELGEGHVTYQETDVSGSIRTPKCGGSQMANLVAYTLRAEGCDAGEDGTGRGTPLVVTPIDMRQASRGEKMTNNRREGSSGGAPGTGIGEEGDPAPTLADTHTPAVASGQSVRRLTPVECLRLMGMPDDYLDLDPPLADSAKYRLIGNSIVIPVAEWIGRRIVAALRDPVP